MDDGDVPLSDFEAVIVEEDVPLSQMPQTGIAETASALTTGLILSALLMAFVGKTIRRLKKSESEE